MRIELWQEFDENPTWHLRAIKADGEVMEVSLLWSKIFLIGSFPPVIAIYRSPGKNMTCFKVVNILNQLYALKISKCDQLRLFCIFFMCAISGRFNFFFRFTSLCSQQRTSDSIYLYTLARSSQPLFYLSQLNLKRKFFQWSRSSFCMNFIRFTPIFLKK